VRCGMAQATGRAKEWREERRLRVWALKAMGWSQQQIAEALVLAQDRELGKV